MTTEVKNVNDFEMFLASAKRGERVIYHKGFLPFEMKGPALELARAAMLASTRGQAALTQRRLAESYYEYLAERC